MRRTHAAATAGLLLVIAGCATPQYRAERDLCTAEWMKRLPPVYEDRLVNKTRFEERLTGVSTCTTEGNVTRCVEETVTVPVPYVAVETVDIRKEQRDLQIRACTARACTERYGNAACEV